MDIKGWSFDYDLKKQDKDKLSVLIPPSSGIPWPSLPVQLLPATATMSNPSGFKRPDLFSDILTFFKNAYLGHRDTDPVPLVCQQKGINDIQFFGLLSDVECNFFIPGLQYQW